MAHHKVDNFYEYLTEINDPLDTPYFEPTSLWTKQYEPTSSPPIVPLLDTPPDPEMIPLPVMPTNTLPVTYSQEAQIVGVLNSHRQAVGWDICRIRDSNFIADLSVFGTTFKDCLHNLSFILKRCLEANLKLTWIQCQQERMVLHYTRPKRGIRVETSKDNTTFESSPPLSAQYTQSFPQYRSNYLHQSWFSMFALSTLGTRTNRHRTLYEKFSAMMTRPPDWPCLFKS